MWIAAYHFVNVSNDFLRRNTLGVLPQPADSMASGADVIACEEHTLKSAELSCALTVVLVRRHDVQGNGAASQLNGLKM